MTFTQQIDIAMDNSFTCFGGLRPKSTFFSIYKPATNKNNHAEFIFLLLWKGTLRQLKRVNITYSKLIQYILLPLYQSDKIS